MTRLDATSMTLIVYPILAQVTEAIEQAERLAKNDDRVLFIVTLILFFVAGGVAMRWFMLQLRERDTVMAKMREDHRTEIAKLYAEVGAVRQQFNEYLIAAAREMHAVIAKNTETIEQNSEVITRSTETTEKKMGLLNRIEESIKVWGAAPATVKHTH